MKFWHNSLSPMIKIGSLAALVGSLAGLLLPLLIRIFSIDGILSFFELLGSFLIVSLVLNIFVVDACCCSFVCIPFVYMLVCLCVYVFVCLFVC